MPVVDHARLRTFVEHILDAVDVPADESEIVARLSVASNLAGHDSHGVALIPTYVSQIEAGTIRPGAAFEVVRESPTTTVIEGNGGFGYVVTDRAIDLTMQKAADCGVAIATIRGQSHMGRLAAYPIKAARQGFIAMVVASGRRDHYVAPFGGREARLGTNPISVALPSALDGVFAFDMATSAVAGGKVRLAQRAGEAIPPGWIIDREGRPSCDPDDLDRGGALVPVGGPQAYKGYALSATIEVLGGILPGMGLAATPEARFGNGAFVVCISVSALHDLEQFEREVEAFVRELKATPPADGFDEVFYPGERAHRCERDRTTNGVPLTESTWEELGATAARLGVPADAQAAALIADARH